MSHPVPDCRVARARRKDAGKLAKDFVIPDAYRENFPERIAEALKPFREADVLASFPFGSDFTDVEQALIPALQTLRDASPFAIIKLAARGSSQVARPMRLRLPASASTSHAVFRIGLYRALVSAALNRN